MSGDERINAPPVCIFQIIVALYQSRTPLGSGIGDGRTDETSHEQYMKSGPCQPEHGHLADRGCLYRNFAGQGAAGILRSSS